jgi:hypothetical protein
MHVEMSSNSLINRLFNVKNKLNNMRCTLKKNEVGMGQTAIAKL